MDSIKRWMLDSQFTKVLLVYLCILISIIGIGSTLVYYSFYTINLENIHENISDKLTQNVNQIRYFLETAKAMGRQLSVDPDFVQSMYDRSIDPMERYMTTLRISKYVNVNPYLSSIYLYNATSDEILSNRGTYSEDFYDKQILELIKEGDPNTISILPRILEYKSTSSGHLISEKVITIIMRELESAIVVNLKAEYFQRAIQASGDGEQSDTIVFDNNGIVLCDSSLEEFSKDISAQNYMSDLLTNHSLSGYSIVGTGHNKVFMNYIYSSEIGYHVVDFSSYEYTFGRLTGLRTRLILISFLIMVIGITLSLLATRSIYIPFHKVVERIRRRIDISEFQSKGLKRNGELEYIASAIDSSFDLIQRQRMLKFLRNGFHKALDVKVDWLEHDHADESQVVVLFCVDDYIDWITNTTSEKAQRLGSDLETIILKNLISVGQIYITEHDDGNIPVILRFSTKIEIDGLLKTSVSQIQQDTLSDIGVNLSCVCGRIVPTHMELPLSYIDCIHLLYYRLIYGKSMYLTYKTGGIKNNVSIQDINRNRDKLIQCLKSSDRLGVNQCLDHLFSCIKDSQYDLIMTVIKSLLMDLLYFSEIYAEGEQPNLTEAFSNFNFTSGLLEIKIRLAALCTRILDYKELQKDNRKTAMAKSISDYVATNYNDFNLGNESIARANNLSASYINKIFKDETGETLNDLVHRIRMENAIILLMNSQISIKDIACKVGFNNYPYFVSQFKRHTGDTPTHYRREHSKNQHLS